MKRKREAENSKDKQKKKKKKSEPGIMTNLKIVAVRSYDKELGSFVLKDRSYMDILQVEPKDRANLKDDDVAYNIYRMSRFYKTYAADIKFVSLNFPINTAIQRRNLMEVKKRTTDPVRRLWLDREIDELITLDENVTRREYFLFFFGDDKKTFIKNKSHILKSIGQGHSRLVSEIDESKKVQIAKKLCNMNSMILPEDACAEDI